MADEPKKKASFLGGKQAPAGPQPVGSQGVPAAAPTKMVGVIPKVMIPLLSTPSSTSGSSAPPQPVSEPPAVPQDANPEEIRSIAEQYLQRGLDHYDRQEHEEALHSYQQAVQMDPSFALAWNNLGMVLIDLERYDEAIDTLFNAIHQDANNAEAFNNLGFVLRRTGRDVEGASAYARFLELEPDVEEGPKIAGWIQQVMEQQGMQQLPRVFDTPGMQATQPLPVAPSQEEYQEIYSQGASEAQPADEAGQSNKLQKIPSWQVPEDAGPPPDESFGPPPEPTETMPPPEPVPAARDEASCMMLIEKGMDDFARGELDSAADYFKQAMEADPESAEACCGLGKVYVRQEKMREGLELLERASQLDPHDPSVYYVLGFSLRAVERNVEAAEAYEQFLILMPDALDAAKMRQWIQHVKGIAGAAPTEAEDGDAVDEHQIAEEKDPNFRTVLEKYQVGDFDAALRKCIEILTENPGDARTRILLARIYIKQGNLDGADEQLQGALIAQPDNPEALYFLGRSAERRGDIDKAAENFRNCLRVAPGGNHSDKLHTWFVTHGLSETEAGPSQQAQCEWCLRYFPEGEIIHLDGKRTCGSCMQVMGASPGAPKSGETVDTNMLSVDEVEAELAPGAKRKSKSKLPLVGGLVAAAALIAIAFQFKLLDPLIKMVTGGKGTNRPPVVGPVNPSTTNPVEVPGPGNGNDLPLAQVDLEKLKLSKPPSVAASPFRQWGWKLNLENLDAVPEAKKARIEYQIKDGPPGMTVDKEGNVKWIPEPRNYDTLKGGELYRFEVIAKGSGPAFTIRNTFEVNLQFGFEFGPELDLKAGPSEKISLSSVDLNRDGTSDLIVGSGGLNRGGLRAFLSAGDRLSAEPVALALDGRYAAVCGGDVNGDGKDDILCAHWSTGNLKSFSLEGTQLKPGAITGAVGAGAIAMTRCSKNVFAVLSTTLSVKQPSATLSFVTLRPDGTAAQIDMVPLQGSGAQGMLIPWQSADGDGVVVVTPLADAPLTFVSLAGKKPVVSSIDDSGVITAAAVLQKGFGQKRLALIAGSARASSLLFVEEKGGKLAKASEPVALPGTGLGMAASDFNQDGVDDLFVVMPDESAVYFSRGAQGCVLGPKITNPQRMLGPVVLMNSKASTTEILLATESRRAIPVRTIAPANRNVAAAATGGNQ